MAEGHSIVVYVRGGAVQRVAFCECCPPVEVEVRTYEADGSQSPASTEPIEPMFPEQLGDGRWRDHEGTYRVVLYEPADE